MTEKATVLVVEDDQDMLDLLTSTLATEYEAVLGVTSETEALELARREDVDVVLSDLGLGEMGGIELCRRLHEDQPELPVIFVTGKGSMETAIDAMRVGAYDFLLKPVDKKLLHLAVLRAAKDRRLQREVERLRLVVDPTDHNLPLIGSSDPMRRVYELVGRVAPSDASVLVCGETGTGKELVARAIHDCSKRKRGPFMAINCAAVPASLLESELFGHAKGAFTDAKQSRLGLFLQADGGTVFLDELGEMPLDMQAKLLRALQERKVRPVGSDEEVPFDVRILAATNRDLEKQIEQRRFREDLYYRVNVVRIDLPPLRERTGDILELAQHFLNKFGERDGRTRPLGLSASASEKLMQYDWPGNVRELENALERAAAMARGDLIEVEELPDRIRKFRSSKVIMVGETDEALPTLDELERLYIERVLRIVGGNKSKTAQLLGLDRRTLYRKLARESEASKNGERRTSTN